MDYKICSIILALFLSGCALMRPEKALHHMDWKDRQTQLKNIENWEITGSISITQNGKTDIGAFYWNKQEKTYEIELSGPMSLSKIRIVGNDKKVVLQRSEKEQLSFETPEKLLFSQFGWEIPITNLVYWIKALPSPISVESLNFDGYNHLVKLKQQDWNIEYLTFKSFDGIDLPTKIYLENKKLRIKIIVKKFAVKIDTP